MSFNRPTFVAILLAGLFAFIAACQATPVVNQPVATPTGSANVEAYKLGAGDEVKVTVFGEDDLSGLFEVDGSGTIAMPLIGEVTAINLTVRQLETSISNALAGKYLKNPQVSAEVTNYRPFYILGEINNPGEYPYTSGLTVMRAVASAGGFTYRANKKQVYIKRLEATSEVAIALDSTVTVNPGDTIRIGERIF